MVNTTAQKDAAVNNAVDPANLLDITINRNAKTAQVFCSYSQEQLEEIFIKAGMIAVNGMDAVTRSIETLTSFQASDGEKNMAIETLKDLFIYLPLAYADPENEIAKERVQTATKAAFYFDKQGPSSSLAIKLNTLLDIPVGVSNAIMITRVLEHKLAYVKHFYAQIAEDLQLGGNTLDQKLNNLVRTLERLRDELEIPKAIKELGVSEEKYLANIDQISKEVFDEQCRGCEHKCMQANDVKQICIDAYYD